MQKIRRDLGIVFLAALGFACLWPFLPTTRAVSAAAAGTTVIQKGVSENTAYTSGNSVFASDLSFVPRNGFVRLTVAHSAAAVPQIYLIGASTTALPLNANVAMVADGLYTFDVPMRANAGAQAITYNVRLSATGTIRWMLLEEYSNGD